MSTMWKAFVDYTLKQPYHILRLHMDEDREAIDPTIVQYAVLAQLELARDI